MLSTSAINENQIVNERVTLALAYGCIPIMDYSNINRKIQFLKKKNRLYFYITNSLSNILKSFSNYSSIEKKKYYLELLKSVTFLYLKKYYQDKRKISNL